MKENAGRDHAANNNNTFTHCPDQLSPSQTPTPATPTTTTPYTTPTALDFTPIINPVPSPAPTSDAHVISLSVGFANSGISAGSSSDYSLPNHNPTGSPSGPARSASSNDGLTSTIGQSSSPATGSPSSPVRHLGTPNLYLLTRQQDASSSAGPTRSASDLTANGSQQTKIGPIVGGIVGGVVAVLLVLAVVDYVIRRRMARNGSPPPDTPQVHINRPSVVSVGSTIPFMYEGSESCTCYLLRLPRVLVHFHFSPRLGLD